MRRNKWIEVSKDVPKLIDDKVRPILVYNGKIRFIAYYFPDRFKTVEFEDWDYYEPEKFGYMTNDPDKGCVWLNEGWYVEKYCDSCDTLWWEPVYPTHWIELPIKPE